MLCATLAAPPSRACSDSNWTTGTGASGEILVTRPMMKRSSMTSPTTSTGRPAKRATRSRARRGVDGRQRHHDVDGARTAAAGSVTMIRNSHQHFGVAEVVLEEAGGQQRGDGRERRRGQLALARREAPPQVAHERDDEPEPERERRQAALGGDLQKVVVQVRVDVRDAVGADQRVRSP